MRSAGPARSAAKAHAGLADVARYEGKDDEAEPLLRDLVASEWPNADYQVKLAALREARGDAAEAKQLRRAAERYFEWSVDSGFDGYLRPLALLKLAKGDYKAAANYAERDLALRPNGNSGPPVVSLPMLVAGLMAGVLVSLFQTVTSIQDNVLAFIPRAAAIFAVFALTFPGRNRFRDNLIAAGGLRAVHRGIGYSKQFRQLLVGNNRRPFGRGDRDSDAGGHYRITIVDSQVPSQIVFERRRCADVYRVYQHELVPTESGEERLLAAAPPQSISNLAKYEIAFLVPL